MPPNLFELLNQTHDGKYAKARLTDGREVEFLVDCPTYISKSDDDDTDVPALLVLYRDGSRELLTEDDIEEILSKSDNNL